MMFNASSPRRRILALSVAFGALVGLVTSVQAGSSQVSKAEESHSAAPAAKHEEPAAAGHGASSGGHGWGYQGKTGPEFWGDLNKDYHLCKLGGTQSPVDLTGAEGAMPSQIEFDYHLTPLTIVNNGHTVQVNYAPGSGIIVNGKRYELLQFHFHAPSEHAIEGGRSAMEMHLVHKNAEGALAVIGIMMNLGEENLALSEFWSQLPRRSGPEQTIPGVLINARDFLPRDAGYYRYMGSLTTPPCSEGVNWYVMTTPVTVSNKQAEAFSSIVGENARPLQAVKNRLILGPIVN
jgi:carbonic anhydrase